MVFRKNWIGRKFFDIRYNSKFQVLREDLASQDCPVVLQDLTTGRIIQMELKVVNFYLGRN